MILKLFQSILGVIAAIIYFLNILISVSVLFIIALIHLITPVKSWRKWIHNKAHQMPEVYALFNELMMSFLARIKWDIQGNENLNPQDWYLLISNHQTWTDILVLQKVFRKKIPSLRFFMKKELLWQLPIAAQACLYLDYPFMQRYSKEYLTKHPEMKGKDIETTKKACEKFKNIPTSVINFVEGGRFSKVKHKRQNSPYQYLLKPKSGGAAFVLATMGEYLHTILNITIIYPDAQHTFWDFLCGRVRKIIVRVEKIAVTEDLLGDYENSQEHRVYFQRWMNGLWQEKDKMIKSILQSNVPCENNESVISENV